jgi:hypothetical protein
MEDTMMRRLQHGGALLLAAFVSTLATALVADSPGAEARTFTVNVDCARGDTITSALALHEQNPLVIVVLGACNETITIARDDVTLQGHPAGGAVSGPDTSQNTISIDGARRVVIEHLTVSGGRNGVAGIRGAAFTLRNSIIQSSSLNGVAVRNNSQAVIDGNVIEGHVRDGIQVATSSATIINNAIRDNRRYGVLVFDSGSALIGLSDVEIPAGNVIEGNDFDGIEVVHASSATLYANTIQHNGAVAGRFGILAVANSVIRLLGLNTVKFNGRSDGVGGGAFLRSSTLFVGRGDSAVTPNNNDISNNTGPGILAEENATVDLRDGLTVTSNGNAGVVLNHGSRLRIANTTVSGNTLSGIFLGFASGARFLTPAAVVTGNGFWGLLCGDGESSFTGDISGISGNPSGPVLCTGF